MVDHSEIGVYIDTLRQTVRLLPAYIPKLVEWTDFGTRAGSGYFYHRCLGNGCFVYSFMHSELMLKASLDHMVVEKRNLPLLFFGVLCKRMR